MQLPMARIAFSLEQVILIRCGGVAWGRLSLITTSSSYGGRTEQHNKIETFQMLKSGKGVEKHPEGSEHFVGSI